MAKLSIIVPVYHNANSIAPLSEKLTKLEKQLEQRGVELELIFVDDGSKDDSLSELLKFKSQREETKVIKLTRNFGAPHASKTGFRFATGDCFMTLAADLQDPPELIPEMVEQWQSGNKFVVCIRAGREDPIATRFWSALYYRFVRLLVLRSFPTQGYDWALMDRKMLPYVTESSKNINTPLLAYWLGFKPCFIQYRRAEREHGKSQWTFWKKFRYFVDSLLGFSIAPIRIVSLIGLFVSVLSFTYGSIVVFNAFLGRNSVPGFATVVSLLSFLGGIIIVMLGMIGEYLWRIFDEATKRPEAVVDEIY